jgi:hypothetical protein
MTSLEKRPPKKAKEIPQCDLVLEDFPFQMREKDFLLRKDYSKKLKRHPMSCQFEDSFDQTRKNDISPKTVYRKLQKRCICNDLVNRVFEDFPHRTR